MSDEIVHDNVHRARSAPWFEVPDLPIVGLEHPCMISNLTKAVGTVGGLQNISNLIGKDSAAVEASLYLHPEDRFRRPVTSYNNKTANVLVKIIVPRRTGRKRKRGSQGEWVDDSPQPSDKPKLLSGPKDARRLFRSLEDNVGSYQVEPVGSIQQTHRFRRLPDFAWSTENNRFLNQLRDKILPLEYPGIKEYKFDWAKGFRGSQELIPPPSWTEFTMPYNYSYRQNPAVQQILSTSGPPVSRNFQLPTRNRMPRIPYDTNCVPTELPDGLTPESALPATLQKLIAAFRAVFVERPVCTRRVVQNKVPYHIWKAVGPNTAKYLWQYVGYIWSSGPWQNCICTLGFDPRQQKEMRFYQTLVFQLGPELRTLEEDDSRVGKIKMDRGLVAKGQLRQSHLFDGRTVSLDGKIWQMCDLTDPLLKSLVDSTTVVEECDLQHDGWFANGALAKIRIIMRTKLEMILNGEEEDPERKQGFLALTEVMPDVMTEENQPDARFEKGTAAQWLRRMAGEVRSIANKPWIRSHPNNDGLSARRKPTWKVMAHKLPNARTKGRKRIKTKDQHGKRAVSSKEADFEEDILDPQLKISAASTHRAQRTAATEESENEAEDSEPDENADTSSEESDQEEDDMNTDGSD
ncbi:MAG: hypothetical protein Q9174_001571 [Haloplaca sp. 1 TL-2023]